MCGIYGFVGKATKDTQAVIRLLGLYNISRGRDSSGMAVVGDNYHKIFKIVGNTQRLHSKTGALSSMPEGEVINVLGHTRAATTGAVVQANSHPFKLGRYIYTHNGMIGNHFSLATKYNWEFEVDSQAIGYSFLRFGEIKSITKKLSGWWAIPYTTTDNYKQLRIARNTSPAHVAIDPNGSGLYYSSEYQHLRKAISKSRLAWPIHTLADDTRYTFAFDSDTGVDYYTQDAKPSQGFIRHSYYGRQYALTQGEDYLGGSDDVISEGESVSTQELIGVDNDWTYENGRWIHHHDYTS